MSAHHIHSETRWLELSLGVEPNRQEREHLRTCADCAARWSEELELDRLLRAMPQPEVPRGFAERTVVAFREERRAPAFVPLLAASLLVGAVLGGAQVLAIGPTMPVALANLTIVLAKAAGLVVTLTTVATSIPGLIPALAACVAGSALAFGLVFAPSAHRATAPVK